MWNTIKKLVCPHQIIQDVYSSILYDYSSGNQSLAKWWKGPTLPLKSVLVLQPQKAKTSKTTKISTLAAFFRSPALWSSQNVYGPPTMVAVVGDIKDQGDQYHVCPSHLRSPTFKSISRARLKEELFTHHLGGGTSKEFFSKKFS